MAIAFLRRPGISARFPLEWVAEGFVLKNRLPIILSTVLILALPVAAFAQDAETAKSAVVKISGERNGLPVQGSGFVVAIDDDGATIVTAGHVVVGLGSFEVKFAAAPLERFAVDALLRLDTNSDLAVFRVRGAPASVSSLVLYGTVLPRPSEDLLILGFPQNTATLAVKRIRFSTTESIKLLLDIPVGKGFSGSPVLHKGRVIGLVTSEDAQLTYAIDATVVSLALSGWGVASEMVICRSGEIQEWERIEFVRICAGEFLMGSSEDDSLAADDEKPAHKVSLSEYWIGKAEITNAQYRRFKPEHRGKDQLPVTNVGWYDAQAFCQRFGDGLPTEAQWEYAARAGSSAAYSFGDDESKLKEYAWYGGGRWRRKQPVGTKKPNRWGLHDMHGNVWEWVADWYGEYSGELQENPRGPESGKYRVVRGGNINRKKPKWLRSALRVWDNVDGNTFIGFRCVRDSLLQP